MPSSQKTPANSRKKVTASARARLSTRNIRRTGTKKLNESYIQSTPSDLNLNLQADMPGSSTTNSDSSDAILSMLSKLSESNQAIIQRIEAIEQRQQPEAHELLHQTVRSDIRTQQLAASDTNDFHNTTRVHTDPLGLPNIPQSNRVRFPLSTTGPSEPQRTEANAPRGRFTAGQTTALPDIHDDGIMPTLDTLRRTPSISNTVAHLLDSYEEAARFSLQGRSNRKSGRYNTTDVTHSAPEFRWPNEGYHAPAGKKRVPYDDLTLPQWTVGQLTNIYHMKDQNVSKQALFQVILAMRDATSLPWPAVRGAWATSMHDLEEGHLTWQDATQWSLNRLSSSQISMATAPTTQTSQPKRICKFFNEGSCTHDATHGQYRHICSYCDKQGKVNGHPESKCYNKLRTKDKQPS